MTESQVTGYDVTVSTENITQPELCQKLNEWCKKWVFQRERSESSSYEHFKCRVHLIKKKRVSEVKKLRASGTFIDGHWSITLSTVHNGAKFNYAMKAKNRLEGPWTDEDSVVPPPLTRQLTNFMKLKMYPWQMQLKEMISQYDERSIKLIYDVYGNAGKSVFCEYLEYHNLARELPPLQSLQNIMTVCMRVPKCDCYVVNMPRGMKKDKLAELYSGLECLKNGKMYDVRYSYKRRRIDRPQIVVFTNTLPDWSLIGIDRWEVWEMQPDKSLKAYPIPF